MKITRTVRSTRTALAMGAVLALAVLPATAAVPTQDSASTAAGGSLVAGGTVAPAPAVAGTGSTAAGDAGVASPQTATAGLDGAATSPTGATAAQAAAASVPSDESGSTEAKTAQRSCGAKADSHYVPSSGKDASACYDKDGNFQSSRTYTATHYSNDVTCGSKNVIWGTSFTDTYFYGAADTDGGYVQFCSDDFIPGHGRVTARGDADGSAQVVVDGDKDNPEEISQGWASATVSADGPAYRCGKPYSEGGRGSSDAPTSADNAEQCEP